MSIKVSGLRSLGNSKIRVSELHFQYVAPVFNDKFWPKRDMSVSNSPHVRFLKRYRDVGMDFNALWDTDYVRIMEYWNSIGFHNRDKNFIKGKIRRFLTLYRSMKKHGFLRAHRIQVLKKPFWITRYNGREKFLKGYEIWHGHHRASCCHILGISKMPCIILEDIKPGSEKCVRIDKKLTGVKNK
tara:strand:+ start:1099 stop:1653 length:555 start_codon:yes stop_codon:yes gene_type:complete